jgi:hypothetical protein
LQPCPLPIVSVTRRLPCGGLARPSFPAAESEANGGGRRCFQGGAQWLSTTSASHASRARLCGALAGSRQGLLPGAPTDPYVPN